MKREEKSAASRQRILSAAMEEFSQYEVLDKVSNRIVNEVRGVNRVLYDITSKPPATVAFE